MDFDPRITSDGLGYGAGYWHCNFHFGQVYDVLEEDAKNKEACLQALQHLIARADADINDLEDELAILQCQHKWAEFDEHENPYQVCCDTFRRRIDSLTSSIQGLKNGSLLHGHGVLTLPEIWKPAERICDIVNALIKRNFKEPVEEVGDICHNHVSSVSPEIDIALKRQSPCSEASGSSESERLRPMGERLDEPAPTVSEESSSDAARYASKDLTELKGFGASDVDVSMEIENAGSASEGKNGLLTSIETVTFQSPYQASNDEEISKAIGSGLQDGESENCMEGSQTGSGTTLLVMKTEEVVMDEQEGHLTNMQDSDYPTPAHQSLSVADYELAYGLKKSNPKLLEPTEQKSKRKNPDAVRPSNPTLTPKPQGKNKRRKSSFIEDNNGQTLSPSPNVEGRSSSIPETTWRRKLGTQEDTSCGNPPQVPDARRDQPKGARKKFSSIQPTKVKAQNAVASAQESLASKAQNGVIVCLKSPDYPEVKSPVTSSDYAKPETAESKTSTLKVQKTADPPTINLEDLKQKISVDSDFLNTLKVPELKVIVRQCKLCGVTKLKKEHMIQQLMKFLFETSVQHGSANFVSRTQDLEEKAPAEGQVAMKNQSPGTADLFPEKNASAIVSQSLTPADLCNERNALAEGQLAITNQFKSAVAPGPEKKALAEGQLAITSQPPSDANLLPAKKALAEGRLAFARQSRSNADLCPEKKALAEGQLAIASQSPSDADPSPKLKALAKSKLVFASQSPSDADVCPEKKALVEGKLAIASQSPSSVDMCLVKKALTDCELCIASPSLISADQCPERKASGEGVLTQSPSLADLCPKRKSLTIGELAIAIQSPNLTDLCPERKPPAGGEMANASLSPSSTDLCHDKKAPAKGELAIPSPSLSSADLCPEKKAPAKGELVIASPSPSSADLCPEKKAPAKGELVIASPSPSSADLCPEKKAPAEVELAIASQSLSAADPCHDKEQIA